MSNERYKINRARVFEIYGIDPKDRRYDCHHIVQKSDVKRGLVGDFDVNEKSNLYPTLKEDHKEINRRIQELEKGIRNEISRKNATSKRKQKRGKRR